MKRHRLFTRREVIEIWLKQKDEDLDTYVCPHCRDLLFKKGETYFCNNFDCSYYGETIELIGEEE